jgi:hypothetical protein
MAQQQRTIAVAAPKGGQVVATGSHQIDFAGAIRKMAAPFIDVRAIEVPRKALWKIEYAFSSMRNDRDLKPEEITRYAVDFRKVMPVMPSMQYLREAEDRLTKALAVSADDGQISMMAGILNDAMRVKSGDETLVYADMMVLAFEDLPPLENEPEKAPRHMPPSALAQTVIELCRTSTFRPAIAEVIAMAREQRRKLYGAHWSATRLQEGMEYMQTVICEDEIQEAMKPDQPEPTGQASEVDDDFPFR